MSTLQSVVGARDYLAHESHDCRDFHNVQAVKVKRVQSISELLFTPSRIADRMSYFSFTTNLISDAGAKSIKRFMKSLASLCIMNGEELMLYSNNKIIQIRGQKLRSRAERM